MIVDSSLSESSQKDKKQSVYYKDGMKYIGFFYVENDEIEGIGSCYKISNEFPKIDAKISTQDSPLKTTDILVYHGGYKKGLKDGDGNLYKAQSDGKVDLLYKGSFKNGIFDGKGFICDSYGNKCYEGDFKEGMYHGIGKRFYHRSDFVYYEGDFKNNRIQGNGKVYDQKGTVIYEGKFDNGQIRGRASYFDEKGMICYTGEQLNGRFHGNGVFYLNNGDKFNGKWLLNKKHGKGTYYYANGDKYIGDYVNDSQCGKGTYYYSNGDVYEGDFIDNKRHGKGDYLYANSDKYSGDWKYDKKNGNGSFFYKYGEYYVGEWKDDMKNGFGKMYSMYETIQDHDLQDFIGERLLRIAFVTIFDTFTEKHTYQHYVGQWRFDYPNGYGRVYQKNGKLLCDSVLNDGCYRLNWTKILNEYGEVSHFTLPSGEEITE